MLRIPRNEPRIDLEVKDSKPGADVPTVVPPRQQSAGACHRLLDRQRRETPWPNTILHRSPAGRPMSWDWTGASANGSIRKVGTLQSKICEQHNNIVSFVRRLACNRASCSQSGPRARTCRAFEPIRYLIRHCYAHDANSMSKALASLMSSVSNPSVNQS
jgi:hypothetical protein